MSKRPVRTFVNKWSRKLHRWGAILILVPTMLVFGSGLLLQLKKQSEWIQPPTQEGSPNELTISFDEILAVAQTIDELEVESWNDIDRLDVRPDKGIIKIRCNNRWEAQLDSSTGEVVQVRYRRSDLIEQLHDGSWFGDAAKLWVFLPNGVILTLLLFTGAYLWILPISAKRAGRKRRAQAAGP